MQHIKQIPTGDESELRNLKTKQGNIWDKFSPTWFRIFGRNDDFQKRSEYFVAHFVADDRKKFKELEEQN